MSQRKVRSFIYISPYRVNKRGLKAVLYTDNVLYTDSILANHEMCHLTILLPSESRSWSGWDFDSCSSFLLQPTNLESLITPTTRHERQHCFFLNLYLLPTLFTCTNISNISYSSTWEYPSYSRRSSLSVRLLRIMSVTSGWITPVKTTESKTWIKL